MRIFGLIGVPGSGKSTFFRNSVLPLLGEDLEVVRFSYGEGKKQPIALTLSPQKKIAVFGVYEEGEQFPGTDKLSRSCGPAVRQMLQSLQEGGELPLTKTSTLNKSWDFYWEGERFSNNPFFDFLVKLKELGAEVGVKYLSPHPEILKRNRQGRVQNEKWLKGMETRIYKLVEKYGGIIVHE